MEMLVQIKDDIYPNGHPKNIYVHKSCRQLIKEAYPYCPYCGKKITHIKLMDNCGYKERLTKFLENKGFICE